MAACSLQLRHLQQPDGIVSADRVGKYHLRPVKLLSGPSAELPALCPCYLHVLLCHSNHFTLKMQSHLRQSARLWNFSTRPQTPSHFQYKHTIAVHLGYLVLSNKHVAVAVSCGIVPGPYDINSSIDEVNNLPAAKSHHVDSYFRRRHRIGLHNPQAKTWAKVAIGSHRVSKICFIL